MITKYLRPLKAAKMEAFAASLECREDLNIRAYDNVRLTDLGQITPLPEHDGRTMVFDDLDLCAEIADMQEPSEQCIAGTTLYGGFIRKIWGNFLLGSTARLWATLEEYQIEKIDHILFFAYDKGFDYMRDNYLELFELLGIADKIIITEDPSVNVARLLVPDISYENSVFYSPQCVAMFSAIVQSALKDYKPTRRDRKVFLSRYKFGDAQRDEININVLNKYFEQNGFEVISPEKIPLTQLIRIFSECEHIASNSGSIAHNFVFAERPQEMKFAVIERLGIFTRFQLSIEKMIGANTAHVDGALQPKLETSAGKVYIYAMTEQLRQYSRDNNFDTSAFDSIDSKSHRRHVLQRYCRRYKRYYGHSEGVFFWEAEDGDVALEAILDSRGYFSPWLESFLPLYWTDYFNPRFLGRYIKNLIRPTKWR